LTPLVDLLAAIVADEDRTGASGTKGTHPEQQEIVNLPRI
jgi:hypothetical protein